MSSSKQEIEKRDQMADGPLVDIKDIQIDKSLPIENRVQNYLEAIHNPYHFYCGKTPVEIQFSTEDGPHLQQVMTDYFISKKPH